MSETETIARNLQRRACTAPQDTWAALAKELGVSEQYISKRLQGEGPFTTEQLEKAAGMFGMSLYQLMIKLLQPIDGIKQINRERQALADA